MEISCSIKEEYVDIPNVFVGTDSQACTGKTILGAIQTKKTVLLAGIERDIQI